MYGYRGGEFETYHLTCPVCGALPGTSCIENHRELERVHPSRRMSVAERNRRHAATGWGPPELAERHLREQAAEGGSTPLPGTASGPETRRPRVTLPEGIRPNVGTSASASPAQSAPDTVHRGADLDTCNWFAAYLGGFPQNALVPRRRLRSMASSRWLNPEERPAQLSQVRQLQRRPQSRSGSTKGRRSSQKLSSYLKGFEELGLIKRDHIRDTVIVTDPAGLRKLAATQPEPLCG